MRMRPRFRKLLSLAKLGECKVSPIYLLFLLDVHSSNDIENFFSSDSIIFISLIISSFLLSKSLRIMLRTVSAVVGNLLPVFSKGTLNLEISRTF